MKNILACRPGSYGKYHETAFAHLQKIGVKCVEIGVPKPDEIKKTLDELGRYCLRATSLQGSFDVTDVQCVAKLKPQIAATVEMGAKFLFLSVKRGELDKAAAYARLREAGEIGALYGVTIVMETHPDMITNADVAIETMRGVNHNNVRVNFDTANIHYYNEGVDGVAELKKVLGIISPHPSSPSRGEEKGEGVNYVGALHLKETNGKFKTWFFPAFGEGIVNFKEVFRLLNERKFYGPFTMEIEGVQGENLTREQTEERVAKSVEHLRKLGCVE
ncbi:MAG: sugar phosphate isomerase/epimerase [Verrucomicrobiae bacterium]|nr:sugar phosphate isomerase/epimerase [Verrucomicrobiae bacterium]